MNPCHLKPTLNSSPAMFVKCRSLLLLYLQIFSSPKLLILWPQILPLASSCCQIFKTHLPSRHKASSKILFYKTSYIFTFRKLCTFEFIFLKCFLQCFGFCFFIYSSKTKLTYNLLIIIPNSTSKFVRDVSSLFI